MDEREFFMRVLKYAAMGLAGVLLFLALSLLEFVFTLNSTALNPNFIVAEAQKLNIVSVGREIIFYNLPAGARPYMSAVDKTIAENRTWIDEQIRDIIDASYAYLEGKTPDFSVTIHTDPIKASLADNVLEVYLPLITEYQKLSDNERNQYIEKVRDSVLEMVPSSIEINQDLIGAATLDTVQQAREIFTYFRTAYPGLIAFTLVLILLMILIWREAIGATRSLGIIFFLAGAIGLVSYFVLPGLITSAFSPVDMLPQIKALIPAVASDLIAPLALFAVGLLGSGGVLVAVSFLFTRRKPSTVNRTVTPSLLRFP
jgi:hypothetical protein